MPKNMALKRGPGKKIMGVKGGGGALNKLIQQPTRMPKTSISHIQKVLLPLMKLKQSPRN